MLETMFERFTDRARRTVVLAQEEARLLKHDKIDTEHLLLGLIREGEGAAVQLLDRLGIPLEAARAAAEQSVEPGTAAPLGHIPFTPQAKTALEFSLREALALKHNYIGTEHILLGLLRQGKGKAALVLLDLGADLAAAREQVGALVPVTRRRRRGVGGRPYPEPPVGVATPAAIKVASEARRLAQGARVGSQHYLLGLLAEEDSLAAKVLAALGVSRESVEQKLAELGTSGTSDESPEEAGARRMTVRVEAGKLLVEVDDPFLAARLGSTSVSGTQPEAREPFTALYAALSRSLQELSRRLAPQLAPFEPSGWDPARHAALYTMVSRAEGPSGQLQVAPGTDAAKVRGWLREWIADNGDVLERTDPTGAAAVSTLHLVVASAGESFAVQGFGFGPPGPTDSTPAPLADLIHAAIADLAEPRQP